ncbi:MAG: CPBP family intramembrane glutamic endopeptidase, partial [bacterium]
IYVGVNLAVIMLLIILSRHYLDLTFLDLGYDSRYVLRGIFYGFFASLIVVLSFVLFLYLLPRLGIMIKPPIVRMGAEDDFLYRLLIRIPLGTAFFEENLFRGICYGLLIKTQSAKKTFIMTSLLFSFWHIVPALKVVSLNFQVGLSLAGLVIWFAGIIGAFFAGIFFAFLRYKGKSIIGCILGHTLINDLSLLIIIYLWK